MAVDVVVVIHPAAYDKAFKSATGMVGSFIADVAKDVQDAVRFEAPRPGGPPHNRTGFVYATGKLVASIKTDIGSTTSGDVSATVFTNEKHARYVINGTVPHVIKPKTPGKMLRFFWFRKGAWVAFPHVNHPGTMANNFMERGFKKGLAVHGIV